MESLLRTYIRTLLAERRNGKKPGGPRTDLGAVRQLDPGSFYVKVAGAVKSAEGDVEEAADDLDVAPRTLYHYLETEPKLGTIKTTADRAAEDEDE
jgi:hypothetical protein